MVSRVYDVLGDKGEIVDATCSVVRQGFREFEPGPFVLPPAMISDLLLKANPQAPRLGFVIGTAGLFVSSYKRNLIGTGIYEVLDSLLTWVSQLLQAQGGKFWLFPSIPYALAMFDISNLSQNLVPWSLFTKSNDKKFN